MNNPTEEMKAMARRVCASVCGNYAVGRAAAQEFLRGDADGETDMQIALVAIIETQRLDAELAENFSDEGTLDPGEAGWHIATAIRSGKHYGKAEE